MTAVDVPPGGFSFGRVFSNTFAVIARNPAIFLAASVLGALPLPVFELLAPSSVVTAPAVAGAPPAIHIVWGAFVVGILLSILCTYFVQAMLIYGTIVDLNGGKISFGEALKVGLRSALPMVVIAILSGLGAILGFILLVVPGLMLLTAWIVVVPVYVTENPGLLAVFGRSAELTRGYRWQIFGLLLILGLALIALGLVFAVLTGTLGASPTVTLRTITPGQIAGQTIQRVLGLMLGASMVASIYYELRTAKEGVAPSQLAAVFD